jgi:WD40 repeat protein
VISTSEDGRCRVWDSSLGTCLTSLVGHQGKNVWAIATDEEGRILASGGGDGAILLWDLEKEVADQERNTRRWTTKLPPRKQQQGKEKETIRCLKFDSLGKLLAVTNLGSLWQFDGESEQWHPLAHDLLQSYHRMELLTAENVLALASLRGAITLISLDGSFKTTTWTAHARSVLGVFFISGFPHAGPNDLWFCSSGHEGSLCLWKATVLDRQAELTITKIADYTLAVEGKVQGRGENSIAVVSVARHPRSSAVVCGDGYGSLHVFPVPALPVTDRALPALTVAPHAHGNEAVVAVLVDGEGVVLSLSRDGVLNRFLWVEHPDGNGVGVVVALQRITSDRLHKEVEIAERLIVMGTSVFAMAFSGGDMSVYATTHGHKKIFSGKCGSFKRIHDLALTDAFESAAFVEGNTVHIQRTSTPPKRFQLATLREHAHGLQTNAVRLFRK